MIPDYAAAAERYLGQAAGLGSAKQMGQMVSEMAGIAIRPEWVNVLDFEKRFPRAIARRTG